MSDGQSGGLRFTTADRGKKSPSLVCLRDEFGHVARSRQVPGIFL